MSIKRNNGISVIICCYNSATRINKTLEYISRQKTDNNFNWEIVLVDNNSTDDTIIHAQKIWKNLNSNIPLNITTEKKQGLIHARLKGVSTAQYDLLLFCDDDNWLDENYIKNAMEIMQNNPKVGLLGGRGHAELEKGFIPPLWFNEAAKFHYAIHKPQSTNNSTNQIYGAGSVFRKKIFDIISNKNYNLILQGRKGGKIVSGEDIELSFITKILGFDILFNNKLSFKHFLSSKRINEEWITKKITDHYSLFIIGIYMDYYYNQKKNAVRYYINLLNTFFKIILISTKKTLFFQWNFYSKLWLKSQIQLLIFKSKNYNLYKSTLRHIQKISK